MRRRCNHTVLSVFVFLLVMAFILSGVGCSATNKKEEHDPTESTLLEEEPVKTSVRDLPNNEFSLCESFYDGTSLMLAYNPKSMIYPVEFGFVPDSLDDLQNMGRWYINTGWQAHMTQEDYEHVEKMFREEEQCGFVLRYFYLGDHIRFVGGTDLGPWVDQSKDGTVFMKWPSETAPKSNPIQSGLPVEAQNRDVLDLELTIREIVQYHYKDGDTYYYGYEPVGERIITLTVPHN